MDEFFERGAKIICIVTRGDFMNICVEQFFSFFIYEDVEFYLRKFSGWNLTREIYIQLDKV